MKVSLYTARSFANMLTDFPNSFRLTNRFTISPLKISPDLKMSLHNPVKYLTSFLSNCGIHILLHYSLSISMQLYFIKYLINQLISFISRSIGWHASSWTIMDAKINAFLSSQNYKFAIAVKRGFIKILWTKIWVVSVNHLFYYSRFSDVTIITALLRHSAYVTVDGKVIKNGTTKWNRSLELKQWEYMRIIAFQFLQAGCSSWRPTNQWRNYNFGPPANIRYSR